MWWMYKDPKNHINLKMFNQVPKSWISKSTKCDNIPKSHDSEISENLSRLIFEISSLWLFGTLSQFSIFGTFIRDFARLPKMYLTTILLYMYTYLIYYFTIIVILQLKRHYHTLAMCRRHRRQKPAGQPTGQPLPAEKGTKCKRAPGVRWVAATRAYGRKKWKSPRALCRRRHRRRRRRRRRHSKFRRKYWFYNLDPSQSKK